MFGHGQIEGFNEKYGMEYRQAKWHESPDHSLVERHEREIFPLLRRRALFAAVDQFALFDFWTGDGRVDENVFAYVNGQGDERALVIYNNRFGHTRGWLRWSAGTIDKISRQNVRRDLAFALKLTNDPKYFVRAREMASGLEWLFSSRALCEDGLFIEMGAYQRHVFLDIEEMEDVDGRLAALHHEIKGRGVESIEIALRGRELGSLHAPFDRLLAAVLLRRLMPSTVAATPVALDSTAEKAQAAVKTVVEAPAVAVAETERRALEFFEALATHAPLLMAPTQLAAGVGERLRRVLSLRQIEGEDKVWLSEQLNDDAAWSDLIGWAIVADVPRALGGEEDAAAPVSISSQNGVAVSVETSAIEATNALNFWLLDTRLKQGFCELGLDGQAAQSVVDTIQTLLLFHEADAKLVAEGAAIDAIFWREVFADEAGARLLGVHRHEGVLWFGREAWEFLAARISIVGALHQSTLKAGASKMVDAEEITRARKKFARLKEAAAAARYQVEELVGGAAAVGIAPREQSDGGA
jgi:hypothetical protein